MRIPASLYRFNWVCRDFYGFPIWIFSQYRSTELQDPPISLHNAEQCSVVSVTCGVREAQPCRKNAAEPIFRYILRRIDFWVVFCRMFILWPCSIKWWLPHINLFSFFFKNFLSLSSHLFSVCRSKLRKKLLGKKEISTVKILSPHPPPVMFKITC